MSKGLGWAVKLISWFAIYLIISMLFDGDMPFWAYFLVVFLCISVQGVVNNYVKEEISEDDEKKDNKKKDSDKTDFMDF